MKQILRTLLLWCGLVACTPTASTTTDTPDREALRDAVLSRITGAEMPTETLSILDFGAVGDGTTDCKPAFDRAMARAAELGGAKIVVPEGIYHLCGPIHFVSRVCMELCAGATLRFDPAPAHYLPVVKTSWEGTFLYNYSPFIYGYGLHDVSIIGEGTIDGNAATTFATWREQQNESKHLSRRYNHEQTPVEERIFGEGHFLRPQLIQFYECERITLRGVKITNAPFWCVHLLASRNIICDALRYDAKLVNNDGIDPEYAQDVLIQNIEFDNGDDNVAIKCGRDDDGRNHARPSSGIIIRNCRFKGLHGVVLGSEMSAGVENIFIENCTYGGYCKRGLYIKTSPDRGGFIRNIFFNNCEFGEVEDLFFLTSMYAGEGLDNHHFTAVHDIYVEDIRCQKARAAAIVLQGTAQEPLRNIHFTRVDVEEATVGLSMDHTEQITFTECHLGGRAGVPTTASKKDNLFAR
jgi:polygalacturonase